MYDTVFLLSTHSILLRVDPEGFRTDQIFGKLNLKRRKLLKESILFFDREILFYLNNLVFYNETYQITVLALARYLIIVFILVGAYLWIRKSPLENGGFWKIAGRENRQAVLMATLALGVAFLFDLIISHFLPRQRPFVAYPELHKLNLTIDLTSFPSRHAIAVFSIATSIWLAHLWHFRNWGIFLFICAFLIAWARVAAGVHYPSDIIAGMLLGIASAIIIHENEGWIKKNIFKDFEVK